MALAKTIAGYLFNTKIAKFCNPIIPAYAVDFTYGLFDNSLTFARASNGWYFNNAGVLTSAASNAPRFDYSPSTLALQGLLMEPQSTNGIRNNSMIGAVAGTPGTLPTNWTSFISTGLSQQIVGTGTENGIPYIDWRVFGTAIGASGSSLYFEGATTIAAATGQTWTSSTALKLVGGSTANLNFARFDVVERTVGGVGVLTDYGITNLLSSISSAGLGQYRPSYAFTLSGGVTVAFVQPTIEITYNNGAVIDITLRIGAPQIEQSNFATSYILTTSAAVTRAVDVLYNSSIGGWFNSSAGTMVGKAIVGGGSTATYASIACFNDGTVNNEFYISPWPNAVTSPYGDTTYLATAAGIANGSLATPNAIIKMAQSYSGTSWAVSANGNAVTTYTSSMPTVSSLYLGVRNGTAQAFGGWLQSFQYYNKTLTNTQLQQVTT